MESAIAKARQKKYECVITDGFDVSKYFDNVITVKQFLTSTAKYKTGYDVRKQEIVAVFSVKGGTGKTTFVKELAESLPQEVNVIIIDLNFQDGGSDLSYMLELPVLPHIGTYLKEKERRQETLLKNLCRYRSNIYILQAPPKTKLVANISVHDIEEILRFARSKFEVIIFDLPNNFNEITKTAIESSTKKVVIVDGLISEAKRASELEWKDIIVGINPKGWRGRGYFRDYPCFNTRNPEYLFRL